MSELDRPPNNLLFFFWCLFHSLTVFPSSNTVGDLDENSGGGRSDWIRFKRNCK